MQSISKMRYIAGAALAAGASAALAHEEGGWAAIHWHASDLLGLATVGVLAAAVIWLSRRQKRAARKKSDDPR